MIAISADPITVVHSTQQSLQLTYPLLSDADTEVIGAYNVVDPSDTEIARPATYLIDSEGRVAWKYLDTRSGDRIDPDLILTQLRKFEQ